MTVTIPVRKGTRFFAAHKDSSPEWEVYSTGGGVAHAKVVSDDWKNESRPFAIDEVRRLIAMDRHFQNILDARVGFWDRQVVGTILHYHNSFGKFARLEVVMGDDGKPTSKVIALVGKWDRHELPSRRPNGDIHYPYYPKNMIAGETHRYPTDSIWEDGLANHYRSYGDPTGLPAIDLSVPEPTEIEARDIEAEKLIEEIQAVLADRQGHPAAALLAAKKLLAEI